MKRTVKKPNRKKTPAKKLTGWKRAFHSARFVPALAISVFASFLWVQPQVTTNTSRGDVLAYATNISPAGLLSATNSRRQSNGVPSLSSDSRLNSAAQAKANDMVKRDYWSHQTPDGKQPWVFITNAGYEYLAAGENLAYGFMTSNDTVTGWMNSASHKANMLSTNFTEVGFGIANSANYVGDGNQTVVVAMYAKPQVASASTPSTTTPKSSTPTKPKSVPKSEPVEEKKEEPKEEQKAEEPVEEKDPENEPIAVADTDTPVTAAPTKVNRIQLLTGGNAVWSATLVVLAVCAAGLLWTIHHGFKLRRWLKAGENFFVHHIHLDLTVLAIIYLGFVLLSTTGAVR